MAYPDYHTHTSRCGHAIGDAIEYVEAALAMGLPGIGIADHIPLLPEPDPEISMGMCELVDYVAEVAALKARFPGYVLLGVEADYRPGTLSEVKDLLASHPFDYAIGSVHHLGSWGIDDERQIEEYAGRDIDDVYLEYFELVGDAAESGAFTIIGHLDLAKKFGFRPSRSLAVEMENLVGRIARSRVLVEINTAGLRKPVAEAYPSIGLLGLLQEYRVPITFGSDAHKPQDVGADFDHAAALASAAGYAEYATLAEAGGTGRAKVVLRPLDTATGLSGPAGLSSLGGRSGPDEVAGPSHPRETGR